MKRQRGRGRGKPGGGGGGGGHGGNRAFHSTGPDNTKASGSASHIYEKYLQYARDAASAGDRVLAEGYLQHAEHYYRVVRATQPTWVPQSQDQRYAGDVDMDEEEDTGDFATEGEATSNEPVDIAEGAPQHQQRERGPRQDRERRPDRGDRGDRDRAERNPDRDRDRERPVRAEGEEGEGDFRRRRPRRGRFRPDGGEDGVERGPRDAQAGDASAASEGFGDGPRPAFLAGE